METVAAETIDINKCTLDTINKKVVTVNNFSLIKKPWSGDAI